MYPTRILVSSVWLEVCATMPRDDSIRKGQLLNTTASEQSLYHLCKRCRKCLLLQTNATSVADATEASDTKQVCGTELAWITGMDRMLKQ